MGTPLGPKYAPYTYMDPLGCFKPEGTAVLSLILLTSPQAGL